MAWMLLSDADFNVIAEHQFDQVTLKDQSAAPTPGATEIDIYCKDRAGRSLPFCVDDSGVEINIAHDQVMVVQNKTGDTLAAGTLVYISGSTGNWPTVQKAQADTGHDRADMVIIESIANNGFGLAAHTREVTQNTLGLNEGDEVYLSATSAGAWTATEPTVDATTRIQRVGIITKVAASGTVHFEIKPSALSQHIWHGAISGLSEDDHTQYLLVDGSRVMTGALEVDANFIMIKAAEDATASLYLYADNASENPDYWRICSSHIDNHLTFQSYASGAWVDKFDLDTSGNVIIPGNMILGTAETTTQSVNIGVKVFDAGGVPGFIARETNNNTEMFMVAGSVPSIGSGTSSFYVYASGSFAMNVSSSTVTFYGNVGINLDLTVSGGDMYLKGGESNPANFFMYADQGDDNPDKWSFNANIDDTFSFKSYSSGAWVQLMGFDGAGIMSLINNILITSTGSCKIELTAGTNEAATAVFKNDAQNYGMGCGTDDGFFIYDVTNSTFCFQVVPNPLHKLLLHTTYSALADGGTNKHYWTNDIYFVHDSANAAMQYGITINAPATTAEVFALKDSTNVSHGLTGITETDTFFTLQKAVVGNGGIRMEAIAEAAAIQGVFTLDSYGGTADTTKSTAGLGLVSINVYQQDGFGALADIAADGNIVAFRAYKSGALSTVWLVDEDGDTWQSGGAIFSNTIYINETSNANMSLGLTIHQGANDDEILAFKNTNVAHGATTLAETDTYASFKPHEGASGGLRLSAYKDADGIPLAMTFNAYLAENANTTKTWAGYGILNMYIAQLTGTGVDNVVADGNILSIQCRKGGVNTTVFLFDEDGDLWQSGYITTNSGTPGAYNYMAGPVLIGTTTSSFTTAGLGIDQGAADDGAIVLYSSDVSTGMYSGLSLTSAYCFMRKVAAAYGGLDIYALGEDDASHRINWNVVSIGGTADTTKTSAGYGLINFDVYEHDGAGNLANVTADGNIFSIRANVSGSITTRLHLDEDGDMWLAGHLTVGGATVSATAGIKVYETDHINATNYGVQCNVTSAHTSSGTYYNVGGGFISTQTQGSGIDNDGYARGLYVESMLQGAGDLATLAAEAITYGLYTGGTGTIDNAYGLLIYPYSYAAGTITSMSSIYITARVDNGATVTSEWAIYSNHNAPSRILDSLTINQGANDTLIMQFQSSDVAHGITDYVVTSTYAEFLKASATLGGLGLRAYTEDNLALSITAMYTVENTTKTTAGTAPTMMGAWIKSGTGVTTPGANANIFIVRSGSSTKFIVDAEGDYFYDGTGSAFDEYDDAQLVRALTLSTSKNFIRSKFDEHIKYNEDSLVEAGILGAPTSEGGLINGAQLQRLHNGAIWQLYERLEYQEKMIEDLQAKLKLLEV